VAPRLPFVDQLRHLPQLPCKVTIEFDIVSLQLLKE